MTLRRFNLVGWRTTVTDRLARYWPAHLKNPLGLVIRIIRSGDRAALFALWMFVLTLLAIPLDFVMHLFERKRLQQRSTNPQPIIFICGPARSGTTIAHQLLVKALPVSYFSNLVTLFPRSPITAYRLFRRFLNQRSVGTQSFYGKTPSFSGPNDADSVWNRWVDLDSNFNRTKLSTKGAKRMAQFFQAFKDSEAQPIICKNNKLLAFASTVDEHIENAWFICMSRDPVYLAQSLMIAAQTLQGDARVGYGLVETDNDSHIKTAAAENAVAVAVQRVRYNQHLTEKQVAAIGPERFWVVDYEDLCADPCTFVSRVAGKILNIDLDQNQLTSIVPSLQNANRVQLSEAEFDLIKAHIDTGAE